MKECKQVNVWIVDEYEKWHIAVCTIVSAQESVHGSFKMFDDYVQIRQL